MIRRVVTGALAGGAGWVMGSKGQTLTVSFILGVAVIVLSDLLAELIDDRRPPGRGGGGGGGNLRGGFVG